MFGYVVLCLAVIMIFILYGRRKAEELLRTAYFAGDVMGFRWGYSIEEVEKLAAIIGIKATAEEDDDENEKIKLFYEGTFLLCPKSVYSFTVGDDEGLERIDILVPDPSGRALRSVQKRLENYHGKANQLGDRIVWLKGNTKITLIEPEDTAGDFRIVFKGGQAA